MTREDAIDVLKHNYPSACFTDLCDAVELAIQALSAQPEIIRCKDCKYKPVEKEYQYPEKDSLGFITGFWKCKRIESPIDFSPCPCVQGDDEFYHWIPDDDWYCKEGEPK